MILVEYPFTVFDFLSRNWVVFYYFSLEFIVHLNLNFTILIKYYFMNLVVKYLDYLKLLINLTDLFLIFISTSFQKLE